ncbi:MAG: hypothetical protein K2Y27_28495 [Xanthobacteraceae bacterium]|nr:hypothetical protein [Xanthobacteraceae bacterium]
MLRLRVSDFVFGILALAVIALMSLHMAVIVFALVGAFVCGSLYVFAGMIPACNESFGNRVFVSLFLALVASSVVLIVPGTFGARQPDMQRPVLIVAAMLPVLAFVFEVIRTPRVANVALRWLRR